MKITRRRALAGSAALATLSMAGWPSRAWAQTRARYRATRTRYSATSPQGKQMLVKYAKAVGLMMDTSKFPRSDPRSWTFQWNTHWIPGPQRPWPDVTKAKDDMINQVFGSAPPNDPHRLLAIAMWDVCQAHGDNPNDPNFFQELFFLPWHRWYVYYFEEIIRGVLQDQTFTLPYWDYLGGNVSDLSIPPEFRDAASPLFRNNRNPWVNQGERIDKQNPGALNLDAFNETVYIDTPDGSIGFCPVLDSNPHGQVHVLTGNTTNMGRIPFAAGDPVFWLHHCNIDRLWESWNRLPGRKNPTWPNRPFPFGDASGNAVSVLSAGADRVALLKYRYDRYYVPKKVPPMPAPGPNLMAAAAMTKVTRAAAPAPVTLGADRVRVELAAPVAITLAAPGAAAKLLAPSAPTRRIYLVLRGVSAPDDVNSSYNVFLNLQEGASAPGPDSPNYVGTLNFFGAAGHDDHAGGHKVAFNITDKAKALQAQAGPPSVTLVRRGDEPENAKPVVRQILVVES